MSDAPFSNANLDKAVKNLDELPKNQVQFGAIKTSTDEGVELEGEKDFTLGAAQGFAAADVSWFTKAKWTVAGWVGLKWK